MPNYEDHKAVIEKLELVQGDEHDQRELSREVAHFLYKKDGQWEPEVVQRMLARPRYTFDWCSDLVDEICGELSQTDFAMRVKPAGGEASEDTADVLDGMLRNIQNISNAEDVFNDAARESVEVGVDGWRVKQRYSEIDDTFNQDLYIDEIPNYLDSVWWDPDSKKRNHANANWCYVMQTLTKSEYDYRFPDGTGQSIGEDRAEEVYTQKPELITVGELLYREEGTETIHELSNGKTVVEDDDFKAVMDELQAMNIVSQRSRKRKKHTVYTRLFDGAGWLSEPQKTVFQYIPIVTCYANFKVSEGKVIYWGAIHKKMDAQRVYNYVESRKVEEGALAPRRKTMMTPEQVEGHEDQLRKMNVSNDPVQVYNHEPGQTPPYETQGPQINPGLESVANSAMINMRGNADRIPGEPLGLRSGVAVEREQDKQNTRFMKYFTAMRIALQHTAEIIVTAIPKVYDTPRLVRVLGEDGTSEMVQLYDRVRDEETGQDVYLNDVSKGRYDAVCEIGPAFRSRQSESVAAFNEIAAIDPTILQTGKDIWFANMPVPGMDVMAKRARAQMLQQGLIPVEEMSDEEKQKLQQAQQAQGQQQDPNMLAAQAMIMEQQVSAEELQVRQEEARTKRMAQELKQKEYARDMLLLESEMNKNNAAAMESIAGAHKKLGESGLANTEAATAGVDAYNNVADDLIETRTVPSLVFDAETGEMSGG